MAGIRQHIIPRFLLKGFASKTSKKAVFTWVFRSDGKIFESKIVHIGVEKYFYEIDGEDSIDDEITGIEKGFAVLLDELRREDDGYKITNPKLAEFICHLSLRTKHLRDSLIDSTSILAQALTGFLSDKDNFRYWIIEYYKRHPEVIRKAIDDELKRRKTPKHQFHVMRQRLLMMASPNQLVKRMESDISQYALMFSLLGPSLIKQIPDIAKKGHVKALAKNLMPEPRVEVYQQLSWFVIKANKTLILGDVGCLFEVENNEKYFSLNNKDDKLKSVYLPISSDTLIVGTTLSAPPVIDFRHLNEKFAKCSRDYFICRESTSEIGNLQAFLGVEAEIFSKEEILQIVKEVIEEG